MFIKILIDSQPCNQDAKYNPYALQTLPFSSLTSLCLFVCLFACKVVASIKFILPFP